MAAVAPMLLLLGPVMLHGPAGAAPLGADRRAQLLVRLAVEAGRWVPRDHVAELLWPEHDMAQARRNLRKVVFNARALVEGTGFEASDHALRWAIATDLAAMAGAVQEGRLDDAVALLRGPPLGGLDDAANAGWGDWLREERSRALGAWQHAAHARLPSLAEPAPREALARRLLQFDPLDETAVRALIELQRETGRLGDARRTYRDYATRLAEELGVEPASTLAALLVPAAAAGGAAASPGGAGLDAGAFVGRRLELRTLRQLFVDEGARLVTLAGPGGVGKSRLARQWLGTDDAAALGARHWIDLQDLGDGAQVLQRVAQRLAQVPGAADDPVAALVQALGDAPRLLVLDNAEHLQGLAGLLDRLLDGCSGLRLLVTTRVRLGALHERLLALAGLEVPDEFSRDLDAASAYDAVRLFVQRATAVRPGFALERQLAAVIEIVGLVGGLPLAIELAASWARLLPAGEIAADLRESVALLERDGAAPEPERPEHASMRAVLEHSLRLLAPREREALAGLAVFGGGFTAASAREVSQVPLSLLSSLADAGMLQVDDGGRFTMHPLLAQELAVGAATDPGALANLRRRHATHFARRAAELPEQHRAEPRALMQAFEAELANFELAWRHAARAGLHELVGQALPAWRAYFVASGQFAHSVRHFEAALAANLPAPLRAALQTALAYFLIRHRQPARAVELAAEALAVVEPLGDRALVQECIAILGGGRMVLGQWSDAHVWVGRALALAQQLGGVRDAASAHGNLGLICTLLGRFDEGRAHYRQAIALHHQVGNPVGEARAMCNLGFVEVACGDWAAALAPLVEARRFAFDHGVQAVAPEAELLLGTARVELGELDAAEQHFAHCREAFDALGNVGMVLKCDYYVARIAGWRGAREGAARVMLDAVRTARAQRWVYDLLYAAAFLAELLQQSGHAEAAARLLASVRSAPHADASVVAVVDACRRRVGAAQGQAAPFGLVAEALASAADLADAAAGLRALRVDG